MSNDLEQRLQEALDDGSLSDDLLKEVAGEPELEPMIEVDAALRSMPRVEFDLSEGVLARLDDELDEIPGLLDTPHFEGELEDVPKTAPEIVDATPTPPISLDDARRKRSAAPFLLSAAAVIGLVATGTLMTLNGRSSDRMAMESMSSAAPSATAGNLAGSYAEEEMSEDRADELAEPSEVAPVELIAEAPETENDDVVAALSNTGRQERSQARAAPVPRAAAPARMSIGRGGTRSAPMELPSDEELSPSQLNEELSPSQRRMLARVESCLPDHIRVTRVRESADGQRVVGVETSEPLSDSVDGCVSGVLDTFPQARRRARRRRTTSSMSTPASTSSSIVD